MPDSHAADGRKDRSTDNGDFIGPFVGRGLVKQ